ncbi:MAG: hypothetical protein ACK5KR_07920 [Breznakia sp.]
MEMFENLMIKKRLMKALSQSQLIFTFAVLLGVVAMTATNLSFNTVVINYTSIQIAIKMCLFFTGGLFCASFSNSSTTLQSSSIGILIYILIQLFDISILYVVIIILGCELILHKFKGNYIHFEELEFLNDMYITPILLGLCSFMIVMTMKTFDYYLLQPGLLYLLSLSEMAFIRIILGFIIGCLVVYDLGGVVNKMILVIAILFAIDYSFLLLFLFNCAACIVPIAYGLSCMWKKSHFPLDLQKIGKWIFIQGLFGISEGAIMFTIKEPKLKYLNMVCAGIGTAYVAVNVRNIPYPPLGGIFGSFSVRNGSFYILGIIISALLIALLVLKMDIFCRTKAKKHKKITVVRK